MGSVHKMHGGCLKSWQSSSSPNLHFHQAAPVSFAPSACPPTARTVGTQAEGDRKEQRQSLAVVDKLEDKDSHPLLASYAVVVVVVVVVVAAAAAAVAAVVAAAAAVVVVVAAP